MSKRLAAMSVAHARVAREALGATPSVWKPAYVSASPTLARGSRRSSRLNGWATIHSHASAESSNGVGCFATTQSSRGE